MTFWSSYWWLSGGYMGLVFRVFNFWLKCYWSRRKMLFKVRRKFLRSNQKFFRFFKEVWFLAKLNSSPTSLASLARLIASAFLLIYSFFNLSLNFFTSWSNVRQLSYFFHLFLSSIRRRKDSLTQGLLSVARF